METIYRHPGHRFRYNPGRVPDRALPHSWRDDSRIPVLGGIATGFTEQQFSTLDKYGNHIGLAFQVVDKILDAEGDTQTLGMTQGKEGEANKPTYVKPLGMDGASAEAQRLLEAVLDTLEGFGESADHLRDLARYIVELDNDQPTDFFWKNPGAEHSFQSVKYFRYSPPASTYPSTQNFSSTEELSTERLPAKGS